MTTFITASLTRAGGRESNQDAAGYHQEGNSYCWVVADGLGGHRGGEIASQVAVEAALVSFRAQPRCTAEAVTLHLAAAQKAVIERQKTDPQLADMRTTLVMLISDGRQAIWGHVGDTRLYHFENGAIVFTTEDHSVPQVMAAAGEIAKEQIRFHEDRNRLLKSLGKEGDLKPTILREPVTLHRGDSFLLCTDGFWEYVNETEMEVDLAKSQEPGEWLHRLESRLTPRSNESSDNYTAVTVMFALASAPVAVPDTRRQPARTEPHSKTPLVIAAVTFLAVATAGGIAAWRKPEWFGQKTTAQLYKSPADLPARSVYRPAKRATFPNLRQAVEAAQDGETLWIGKGVFDDLPHSIQKRLKLLGAGAEQTTLAVSRRPVVLSGAVISLENLHIMAGEGTETVLELAGDFQGAVRRVRLQGGTRQSLRITGAAMPVLEENTLLPARGGQCMVSDSRRWKADLPAGNTCIPPAESLEGGFNDAKPPKPEKKKPAEHAKPAKPVTSEEQ